jgi:glyoxylase-like metal-dependent hydrolase (beta-lactamase superfamily II)/rhodanese-related sulfurtransferase
MKVEQLYTGCLSEAAYYIESKGQACIIDPLRESQPYLELAAKHGAKIKYVLETHFHADFVSGHLDLAKKTGATIVYGPTAVPNFEAYVAEDGEILQLGDVQIKVLHTPGHTLESSSFLLIDEHGKEYAVFTGDTLFIGDVGRPDLAVKTDLSRDDLAGMLFDSLRNKIMPLADDVIVYPGHGAGSACGKKMSKATESTIGQQKELNYALRANMSRKEFVAEVTLGLVDPPQYFPKNAVMNKMGYQSIDDILARGAQLLEINHFMQLLDHHKALIIDTRTAAEFVQAHIPGSINIGLDGQFASWVGTLVPDLQQPILLLTDAGHEEEAVIRLARVGYDHTLGVLKGGLETYLDASKPTESIESISADEFAKRYPELDHKYILDVRRISEYETEHVDGARQFPLDFLDRNLHQLNPARVYYVYCAGGYRSVIAISILMRHGYSRFINVEGGFNALKNAGKVPVTDFMEQMSDL